MMKRGYDVLLSYLVGLGCVGFAAGAAVAHNSPTLVGWLLVALVFVVLAVQRVRLIETSARIDEIERRERP